MASWVTLGRGIHICDTVKEKYFGVFAGKSCNLGTVVEGEQFTPEIYIAVIGYGPRSNRKIELWYNGSLWASNSDFNSSWHEIYAYFWRGDNEPLMAGAWEARYYEGSNLKLSKQLTITPPPPDVDCIDVVIAHTSIVAGQNPGLRAVWRNNGSNSVTIDAPLIVDGDIVVSPLMLLADGNGEVHYSLTSAMRTAGTHTVEIPPEFNKSGIQPITYEISSDPCEGVVCPDVCESLTLWTQKCVIDPNSPDIVGMCDYQSIREANSPECGYVPPDPCAGVTCENVCIGLNLHSQKCVNGVCVTDQLIEANSLQCGYVPPEPVCTPRLYGDVNGDGVVDQADATLLFNWVSFVNERNTTYKLACPENADVTGNGSVNIGDAILLRNHVLYPDNPDYALGPKPEPEPEPDPVDPCAGVTCGDVCIGLNLHSQKCVNGWCVTDQLIEANSLQCGYVPPAPEPEPEPEQECVIGAKRTLHTCRDGSQIYTEICEGDELGGSTWEPSGESCPVTDVSRFMGMAIPKIMYEGQVVDIVVESYYGATPSSGEPATLTIDGITIDTKNTLAGSVTFRWTATGVGMRRVCVSTPANPVHNFPGSVCDTTMVSAYVPGLTAQVKEEMSAYEEELSRLRDLRKVSRDILRGVTSRGEIKIPATLAGSVVEIDGVPYTVPPGGVNIPATPGDNIVTIIVDGVKEIVSVIVSPGGVTTLPTLPTPWSL